MMSPGVALDIFVTKGTMRPEKEYLLVKLLII